MGLTISNAHIFGRNWKKSIQILFQAFCTLISENFMHCFAAIILEAKSALGQIFAPFACFMIQYHVLDVGGSPHMPGFHSSSLYLLCPASASASATL